MANLNKVMLIGRLTRDPESRTFSNGGKVSKFGFAVNNKKKNQQTGQWEDDPVFIDVEVFNRGENGTLADRVEQTLRKGQQIFIEGHLRLDKWQQDGQNRSKLLLVVDNFQYLEPRADGAGGGMSEGAARPPRSSAAPARRAETGSSANGGFGGGDHFDEHEEEPPARSGGGGGGQQDDDIPF